VLTVLAGTAEFERALIHQPTGAGRIAAKARAHPFGRREAARVPPRHPLPGAVRDSGLRRQREPFASVFFNSAGRLPK
jgi:DNA invertase Pin-like site-specific DNA recombinase